MPSKPLKAKSLPSSDSTSLIGPMMWESSLTRAEYSLLKPQVYTRSPRWRIRWYARIYQSRDETGSLCRPDLYSSIRCKLPYYYGSESSSLYTCNTSWHSVHYMILNKPLVRLTTVHYQSTVSMISFAQVLTAQWSDTIPCWNVRFQVGITSYYILFNTPTKPNIPMTIQFWT